MRYLLAMCIVQRITNLRGIADRLIDREGAPQRRAVYILHHEVIGADIVQSADMRMIQCRDGTRFPLKMPAKPARGNLDSNFAVEPGIHCPVDRTHSARADKRFDRIRTELGARRER